MTNSCEPWSIVLVPRPLSPLAAFAWYAVSELLPPGGLVRKKRFFRWVDGQNSRGELFSPCGVTFNLNAGRSILMQELLAWLKCKLMLVNVPRDSDSRSRAVRNFVWQEKPRDRWLEMEIWLIELSEIEDPEMALRISNEFFRSLVDERINPFTTDLDFPHFPEQ